MKLENIVDINKYPVHDLNSKVIKELIKKNKNDFFFQNPQRNPEKVLLFKINCYNYNSLF